MSISVLTTVSTSSSTISYGGPFPTAAVIRLNDPETFAHLRTIRDCVRAFHLSELASQLHPMSAEPMAFSDPGFTTFYIKTDCLLCEAGLKVLVSHNDRLKTVGSSDRVGGVGPISPCYVGKDAWRILPEDLRLKCRNVIVGWNDETHAYTDNGEWDCAWRRLLADENGFSISHISPSLGITFETAQIPWEIFDIN